MSVIKSRRNAQVEIDSESSRQLRKNSATNKIDPQESSNIKCLTEDGAASGDGPNDNAASTYTSSDMSEEIVVTTDDESSIASRKEAHSLPSANTADTEYTQPFSSENGPNCCAPTLFDKSPLLPNTRRENELNNNGLSNCNLLVNIPERDIRVTIEQWREMATLAALSYGSTGVDPDKLLLSVPTSLSSMSLHQSSSSFRSYDKNRIL